jgi:SOUL heme-binding protein
MKGNAAHDSLQKMSNFNGKCACAAQPSFEEGKMDVRKLFAAALATLSGGAQAIEEPGFTVITRAEVYEVRQYAPYIVAEVIVPGPAGEAGNQGFSLLGGYIFGKNVGAAKIEMTAPVTQTPQSEKIAMTAPVTQAAAPGGFLVQFMMPKSYTLETLPKPTDARVKFREVPGRKLAVITFSGSWSQENYETHLAQLKTALEKANVRTEGEPVFSRYNSPFMPSFFRRNEIWLGVKE